MGAFDVRFKIAGDAQYSRAFELYSHEANDLSDPFDEIADLVLASVGAQFQTEGARSGARWHPLSVAYARWKEANFGARPILVATGSMRAAALDKAQAVLITAHRMLYEIHDDKAAWHQKGSGRNPQRKLVDLTIADRRGFDRILAHWVNGLRRGPLRHSR